MYIYLCDLCVYIPAGVHVNMCMCARVDMWVCNYMIVVHVYMVIHMCRWV